MRHTLEKQLKINSQTNLKKKSEKFSLLRMYKHRVTLLGIWLLPFHFTIMMQPFNVLFSYAFVKCVGGNSIVYQFRSWKKVWKRLCQSLSETVKTLCTSQKKTSFPLTFKMLGVNLTPLPVVFPKMCFLERVELCFFVTLNIIISYIFPENLINIFNYLSINYLQKVQPY